MSLNQCKCGVVHFSRSQQPKPSQYTLFRKPIKPTCSQKDLGIITTSDLKWKKTDTGNVVQSQQDVR